MWKSFQTEKCKLFEGKKKINERLTFYIFNFFLGYKTQKYYTALHITVDIYREIFFFNFNILLVIYNEWKWNKMYIFHISKFVPPKNIIFQNIHHTCDWSIYDENIFHPFFLPEENIQLVRFWYNSR